MLFEELDMIRDRPGVHGIQKIEDLELFLMGLKAAGRIYTFSLRSDPDFLTYIDFKAWLTDVHFKKTYGKTYIDLIRDSARDDRHTLQIFFGLLDKFRAERKKKLEQVK